MVAVSVRPIFSRKFQRAWNSFQAIWNAIEVLPVPVASVSSIRVLAATDRVEHAVDGDVLVVAGLPETAVVLERDGGEAITPGVRFRKSLRP